MSGSAPRTPGPLASPPGGKGSRRRALAIKRSTSGRSLERSDSVTSANSADSPAASRGVRVLGATGAGDSRFDLLSLKMHLTPAPVGVPDGLHADARAGGGRNPFDDSDSDSDAGSRSGSENGRAAAGAWPAEDLAGARPAFASPKVVLRLPSGGAAAAAAAAEAPSPLALGGRARAASSTAHFPPPPALSRGTSEEKRAVSGADPFGDLALRRVDSIDLAAEAKAPGSADPGCPLPPAAELFSAADEAFWTSSDDDDDDDGGSGNDNGDDDKAGAADTAPAGMEPAGPERAPDAPAPAPPAPPAEGDAAAYTPAVPAALPGAGGGELDETRYIRVEVDLTRWMCEGAPFLKYGKRGYPHFRMFRLSADRSAVVWYSAGKRTSVTRVPLESIDDIVLGQHTPLFARYPAPELRRASFSLVYANRTRTLDLIAKDPNDYTVWIRGLQALVTRLRLNGAESVTPAAMPTLPAGVVVRRGRRSTLPLLRAAGVEPHPKYDDPILGSLSGGKGSKVVPHGDAQRMRSSLKKRRRKLVARVQGGKYTEHPLYDAMLHVLNRVSVSQSKVDAWFEQRQFAAVDDEVWRAGVDLESLENMLAAIRLDRKASK